ncbi:hypothetical protein U9M48_012070 [Paspalum notatum var. saurae]|uniref:Uncharacterized protein n=1 Tax=Paspalum notatum var. saurae TaxID=547442 RepID=A0AAQ3WIB1_PASNO
MATNKQQSSTPSFFNFLKEGLLLPARNPRLFVALFSIIVASSSVLLLGNELAFQHLADEIHHDVKALNSTNPSTQTQEYLHLLQEIKHDTRELLLTGAAYLLLAVVVGSAIRVIVLFAAVRTYSGEQHTFGSLLSEVRRHLKGPLLTLAFVIALQAVYVALFAAIAVFSYHLKSNQNQYLMLFFALLLLLVIAFLSVYLVYFSILCAVAVVVAVAEPGCHGAGAVGRARRLMKGKLRRAILFVAVTCVLSFAIHPVYRHAKRSVEINMASGWLLGFVYTVLAAAVQLFADCAMTAFYYECKASTEASAMQYTMVATKEQFDA